MSDIFGSTGDPAPQYEDLLKLWERLSATDRAAVYGDMQARAHIAALLKRVDALLASSSPARLPKPGDRVHYRESNGLHRQAIVTDMGKYPSYVDRVALTDDWSYIDLVALADDWNDATFYRNVPYSAARVPEAWHWPESE
jgi:hypothetical protein